MDGTLPPMVEATLFARPGAGYDLPHLVNGSGRFGVTFYAPVTMHDLAVALPYEGTPREVRSLVTGQACPFSAEGGTLAVRVPRLGLFEAITIAR